MKKITELTETKKRSVYHRDSYGNRIRNTEEFITHRPVKSAEGGQRFVGFWIDVLGYYLVMSIPGLIYGIFLKPGEIISVMDGISNFYSILASNFSLLYLLYIYICEKKWQKTLGKYLLKLTLINDMGEKPDTKSLLLRTVIRIIPIDCLSFLWASDGRGWHDRWSNTWVVYLTKSLRRLGNYRQDKLKAMPSAARLRCLRLSTSTSSVQRLRHQHLG